MRPARPPFEAHLAAGKAFFRQHRRRQAVLGGASGVKTLRHGPEHLAQADRLRGGEAEGPAHLLFRQSEQPPGCGRGAEDTGRARDVPAAIVVGRIHGVADAALHFGAEDERVQEVASRHRPRFRKSQDDGRHRAGRVNDGLQVRVVEIQHVRADAVHQRRVQDVHALAPSEQACVRRAGEGSKRANGDIDRLVLRATDRAPGPVEQRPAGLAPDWRRQVFRPGPHDVGGQRARHVRGHVRRCRRLPCALRRGCAVGNKTDQAGRARAHEPPPVDTWHRAADDTAVIPLSWLRQTPAAQHGSADRSCAGRQQPVFFWSRPASL